MERSEEYWIYPKRRYYFWQSVLALPLYLPFIPLLLLLLFTPLGEFEIFYKPIVSAFQRFWHSVKHVFRTDPVIVADANGIGLATGLSVDDIQWSKVIAVTAESVKIAEAFATSPTRKLLVIHARYAEGHMPETQLRDGMPEWFDLRWPLANTILECGFDERKLDDISAEDAAAALERIRQIYQQRL